MARIQPLNAAFLGMKSGDKRKIAPYFHRIFSVGREPAKRISFLSFNRRLLFVNGAQNVRLRGVRFAESV